MNSIFKSIKLHWNKFVVTNLIYPEIKKIPHIEARDDMVCLEQAMKWLTVAQDNSDCDGVSTFYHLLNKKWGPPYRETTGYIIPTFLRYGEIIHNQEYIDRAIKMGEWEIREMSRDGAVGEPNDRGPGFKIFNTGQVILGMCALYDYTKDKKYLDSAIKSSNWIIAQQENNGSWIKFSNNGANCIDTRVAWSLLETFTRTNDERFKNSATRFLTWAIGQQNKLGWFDNSSLRDRDRPWTHAIAYTISGILESALILKDGKMFQSALISAEAVMDKYNNSKYLQGSFDSTWNSKDKYSCLTGNSQIAIIWYKIYNKTGLTKYLDATKRMVKELKSLQIISNNEYTSGGITGSYPVSGNYASYAIPNWATKFYADALIIVNGHNGSLLG